MKTIIHIEKDVRNKYDVADIYHKILTSLVETASMYQMSADEFFMLITSISFKFMDEKFRYNTLDSLKEHFNGLCERYWAHRGK